MRNRSGFTLIEIMVVMAILGITIPIFLTFSTYTRNMNNEARLRTVATLLAEKKAEELVAQSGSATPPAKTVTTGSEGTYAWKTTVKDSTAVPGQLEIIVDITWRYLGKDRVLQVATYGR